MTTTLSGGPITAIKSRKVLYLSQPELVAALYKWADEVEGDSKNAAIALRAAARNVATIR